MTGSGGGGGVCRTAGAAGAVGVSRFSQAAAPMAADSESRMPVAASKGLPDFEVRGADCRRFAAGAGEAEAPPDPQSFATNPTIR